MKINLSITIILLLINSFTSIGNSIQVDTVSIDNYNCIDSNPWSNDTTVFSYSNDILTLENIGYGSMCPNIINVVLERSGDTIYVDFNRDLDAPICLGDCLVRYNIDIPNINSDTVVVLFENEIYTVVISQLPTIINLNLQDKYSVYPNPVSDRLYFKDAEQINKISISNLDGEIIYQSDFYTESVEFSQFENGIYMIILSLREKQHLYRVIKK